MSFRIEDILKKTPSDSESPLLLSPSPTYLRITSEDLSLRRKSATSHDCPLQRTLLQKVSDSKLVHGQNLHFNFSDYDKWIYEDDCRNMHYNNIFKPNNSIIYSLPPFDATLLQFYQHGMNTLDNFSKRKGGQVRFSSNQTDALEERFLTRKYLSAEERQVLAHSLKLSDRQVKTWFQNRRAKWRRGSSSSSVDEKLENVDLK